MVISFTKGYSQNAAWTIEVRGTVEENDKKLGGATVTLYADNSQVNSVVTPNGSFAFTLNNDVNYTIAFSKPGYVTKRLSFSTTNVPPERSKYGFTAYSDIEVNIFPEISGTDVDQILMQPIGKISYDPSFHNGDFTFDAKYTQSIQSLLDKILAAQKAAAEKAKQLELQYKKIIAKADAEFGAKDYTNAKADYNAAIALKPDEQYPKDQLVAIDKAAAAAASAAADAAQKAAAQKAMQAKYDSLIRIADDAFKSQTYPVAKSAYTGALQVKPNEAYPKSQLALIDKAMADANKKAATQAKYDSLVRIGDNAFKAKSYVSAKAAYNGALQVKSAEQYPKDQLAAIDKAMAEEADANKKAAIQAKYDSLVRIGDNAFKAKSYTAAKAGYNGALQVKPTEQYPKDQLAAIDKAIADAASAAQKAAIQAKYDSLVKIGDNDFKAKDYSNAKSAYNGALQVKSAEQYPKDQLAAIDKALADAANAAQKAVMEKAAQAKYDSLVKIGDNNFKSKSYANAKGAYNGALQVKPNEQYPKDQLAAIDKAIADDAAAANKAAAQKAIQAKYDSLVKIGDNDFKAKDYANAKGAYKGALQVKASEQYPKDQLAAIDKAIADDAAAANAAQKAVAQKALQAKYDSLVKIGDNAFKVKDYANAKGAYNGALQVKSTEQYPKDQLALIDKTLADAANAAQKAAMEKAAQAKYDSLVKIGDNNFKSKQYDNAKGAYTGALLVKSNEQYPKDQLALIDKALGDAANAAQKAAMEKAAQAKYDSLVKIGDNNFKSKKFDNAKGAYTGALQVKPNEQYPKDQLALIDKAMAGEADAAKRAAAAKYLQAQYDSLIKVGDNNFKGKNYSNAKSAYNGALKVKPEEQYPKDQLALIDKALADAASAAQKAAGQKALQARYDSLVKIGDAAFQTKSYSNAKNAYTSALSVKDEQYPKDQLAAIDKALADASAAADAAKQAAMQKALQAKYDSLVKIGDNAFKVKNFDKAKAAYNGALNVKGDEQYPRDQLAAIDAQLSQQKNNDQQYNTLISSGNQNYYMKQYKSALAIFQQATALKPNEPLPKQRIAQIEQLMKNQQTTTVITPVHPKDTVAAVDPNTADSVASKYAQGLTEETVDEPNCQITKRIVVKGKKGWVYTRKTWNFGTYYFKAAPPDFSEVAITEDAWTNETNTTGK